MINVCIVCGDAFESPNQKKHCSKNCYHRWNYRKKSVRHVCVFCGKSFNNSSDVSNYCSKVCAEKHRRREAASMKHCKVCNKELGFLAKGKIYCSVDCCQQWIQENPRWNKECVLCGASFKTNDKKQQYCSHQRSAVNSRNKELYACRHCDKQFTHHGHGRQLFCSRECAFNHRKANAMKTIAPPPDAVSDDFAGAQRIQ